EVRIAGVAGRNLRRVPEVVRNAEASQSDGDRTAFGIDVIYRREPRRVEKARRTRHGAPVRLGKRLQPDDLSPGLDAECRGRARVGGLDGMIEQDAAAFARLSLRPLRKPG